MTGLSSNWAAASMLATICGLAACSRAPSQTTAVASLPVAVAAAPIAVPPIPVSISRGTAVETEVSLEGEGRTYLIPVTINDTITLKFTLDSGASDVAIPADVVMTLFRSGTITREDFLGSTTFTLADGSTVPSVEFRIRTLKVGTLVLHDVTGSVADSRGPLLLGQTFLSRLSNWSIDNGRRLLMLKAAMGEGQATTAAAESPPPAPGTREADTGATASLAATGSDQVTLASRAQDYFAAWSDPQDPDGTGIRKFYAPVVQFYGKPINAGELMAEKIKFARRWPSRTYAPRPASMVTQCSGGRCLLSGVVDWQATDAQSGRHSNGVASFAMRFSGGLIDSETSTVLARQ